MNCEDIFMKDGYITVCAVTPKIKVADIDFNANAIVELMKTAYDKGSKIIVFPELCLTGYTCHDLFLQSTLLKGALNGLTTVVESSKGIDALVFVGLPVEIDGKLYNTAAAINNGKLLGLVPKQYLPNYGEFYEVRHFTPGGERVIDYDFNGVKVPFGQNILFNIEGIVPIKVACELCEDLWVANPPSTRHALSGANIIVNLSASNELVGKDSYRRSLVSATSARLMCAYVYASAGDGESTQDVVFSGHNIIAENGAILNEAKPFANCGDMIVADIDVEKLDYERRRANTFTCGVYNSELSIDSNKASYVTVPVEVKNEMCKLTRQYAAHPFVPDDAASRNERCEQILNIQASGLAKRLSHIGCPAAVIGISGGLDSTLALLVTAKAFDMLGLSREKIISITMPCFGTTDRTYTNACELTKRLGATLREINIVKSVTQHFIDIDHDMNNHNVVYENGQARERTQILMDIANEANGIVIGTGDMSELALGWATYNGDHMSMYAVNSGVPKTLVRHLVKYYADTCGVDTLSDILMDVLDTPVSPELLPPKDGVISQKTEDLVGPYDLHDFYMYYMLRFGFSPSKIYRIAKIAFKGQFDDDTILKWEKTFIRRFFSQQFKRSCLPDGPKVGTTAVSPRGDLRMPSDAVAALWLKELEEL